MPQKVKDAILAALIVLATVIAYAPVYSAGFIWDDPDHILNNTTLRSPAGLWRIWTDRHALPQWYPLVHTTFWIEYRFWGARPAGYHVVNVVLHATSAVILWRLLVMLRLSGAWLAAALFALHPVHVESVAWVTERKNVLSLLFYLLSMSTYLRAIHVPSLHAGAERSAAPDPSLQTHPTWNWYIASFVLFLAALFSKTVTCSLPAALLLIIWWKTGRIRMRDVMWLVPFFAIGLILALSTAHLEQVRVGAHGEEWTYADTRIGDLLARTMIAGKALWFYAWKLVWPAELAFIYERWRIDWREPLQYLYPLGALAFAVTLFTLHRRLGRGPLVAVLLFAGTLLPALGFVNVFPHRYSFVADHFQYHASIALIALGAAILARMTARIPFPVGAILGGMLLLVLGVRTFDQSQIYENSITLWDDTVRKSPGNWMAWTNLGNALVARKDDPERYEKAIPAYKVALQLAPHIYDVQYNAGHAAAREGRFHDAERHFRRAVEIMPTFLPAWESLGDLYADELQEPEKAIDAYRRASEIAAHFTRPREKLERLMRRDETDR